MAMLCSASSLLLQGEFKGHNASTKSPLSHIYMYIYLYTYIYLYRLYIVTYFIYFSVYDRDVQLKKTYVQKQCVLFTNSGPMYV